MSEDDYISEEMLDDLQERYTDSIQGFSLEESVGNGTAQSGSSTAYISAIGVNADNLENADLTLLAGRTDVYKRQRLQMSRITLYPPVWMNMISAVSVQI